MRSLRKGNPSIRESQRAWEQANPHFAKEGHLKRKYGLTLAAFDALFNAQGRVCRCCGSSDPKYKYGWCVDHDHVTGEIRGIVCHDCNVGIGRLGDTLEGVQRAVIYLSSPRLPIAGIGAGLS